MSCMREGGNFVAKIFRGKDVQLFFTSSLRGPPAVNLVAAETPDRCGKLLVLYRVSD